MSDLTDINKVKELIRRIMEENRRKLQVTWSASEPASVIAFDPARRKSREQRKDRNKRREKIEQARKRKEHNEKVVKQYQLRKD